jgi:threonine/homoserine/homoserine lactone efflux protein
LFANIFLMSSIIFFYIACFFISFFFCIPIGPVNIEVFQNAVKRLYPQAISIAVGAAIGDATWAWCAFFGISPFLYSKNMEAIFFVFTSIVTAILGILAIKDARFIEKKEEEIIERIKIKKKRWALIKGLTMVLVNPLGIVSWMVSLSFLRKLSFYIPLELRYEVLFFLVVISGAVSYFIIIITITHKLKKVFSPERTYKVVKFLGYLLILFSLYFLFNAIKLFFFNGSSYIQQITST